MIFNAKTPEDTTKLGQQLSVAFHNYFNENKTLPFEALLLRGPLGSGKTSLARSFVQNLPNGHEAEVSSPSFTLCNSYDTLPEIMHVDLYRCEHNIPHELWEALDISDTFIIIEWAEFLPSSAMPQNFIDIFFKICEQGRSICITAHGPQAELFFENLQSI